MALTGFGTKQRNNFLTLRSPLEDFFGSSSRQKHFSFGSSPFHGVSSGSTGLTANQMLQLMHEHQQSKHRSFVGNLLHHASAAAHPVEWALDKTMRPTYALASAADALVHHQGVGGALHHAKLGIEGKEHTTFSKVLGDAGVLKNHKILRGLAGFGLDVVADPTTYLTFGVGGVAKNAATHAGLAVMKDVGRNITRKEAGKLATEMSAHAKVLKTAGHEFQHRTALAETKAALFQKKAFGAHISAAEHKSLNIARAAAQAEHDLTVARRFKLGVNVPGTMGKKKLMVTLPKLHAPRMTEVAGAHIPLLSRTVENMGKKFVPGYRNEIVHAMQMVQAHSGEQLASHYLEQAREFFKHVPKMKKGRSLKLLHFFERPGGVIEAGSHFIINPERVAEAKKAGFSDKELELVNAMHSTGQLLHAEHEQHGIDIAHLGKKGQLYVPHVYASDGTPVAAKFKNMMSLRGFRKGRSNEFSLHQLEQMRQAGSLPKDLETDPFKLVAMHLRQVAHEHADEQMLRYVKGHLGTPGKVVDEGLLRDVRGRRGNIEQQLAQLQEESAQHPELLSQLAKQHEDNAALKLRDAVSRNRQLIFHHLEEAPHTQTTMATLQRLSKHGTTLHGKYKDELKAIREGTHPEFARAAKPLHDAEAARQKQIAGLHTELEKVGKEERKLLKGKANPDAQHLVPIDSIKNEHGHVMHFEQPVANAVAKLERVMSNDDETLAKFGENYRKYLGKWKIAVTSVNPGYGVRNTLSDFWNMWLSGVPLSAAVVYGGKAAHLMARAKQHDPKAMSILLDAYDHGILSGLFQGDVEEMANLMRHTGSKRALVKNKRFLGLYTKITADINRNRENWGRLTHYMYRREAQGMSITEAAKHVRAAHFDYEELTPFERKVMKSIAPFYTWTRKNIPFQIKALLGSPGRYSAFPKFALESQNAAGGQDGIVPDYMTSGMQFRIPFGKDNYISPMIGVTDLAKLDPHQARETFSSLVTPAVSVPFELATGKNLFTGQDIEPANHTRVPINDRFAGLLKTIPGSNVGLTQRGGKFGQGMDPKEAFLLGQIPAIKALALGGGKVRGNTKARDLAYLTGVNVSHNDQKVQQIIASLHEKDAFKKYKAGKVDENPKLYKELSKRKRKTSKHQQMLDQALYKSLGG